MLYRCIKCSSFLLLLTFFKCITTTQRCIEGFFFLMRSSTLGWACISEDNEGGYHSSSSMGLKKLPYAATFSDTSCFLVAIFKFEREIIVSNFVKYFTQLLRP